MVAAWASTSPRNLDGPFGTDTSATARRPGHVASWLDEPIDLGPFPQPAGTTGCRPQAEPVASWLDAPIDLGSFPEPVVRTADEANPGGVVLITGLGAVSARDVKGIAIPPPVSTACDKEEQKANTQDSAVIFQVDYANQKWKCTLCGYANNLDHIAECAKCDKLGRASEGPTTSLWDQFKPKSDHWKCLACALMNSQNLMTCATCEVKRGEAGTKDKNKLLEKKSDKKNAPAPTALTFSFMGDTPAPAHAAPKFSFAFCDPANTDTSTSTTVQESASATTTPQDTLAAAESAALRTGQPAASTTTQDNQESAGATTIAVAQAAPTVDSARTTPTAVSAPVQPAAAKHENQGMDDGDDSNNGGMLLLDEEDDNFETSPLPPPPANPPQEQGFHVGVPAPPSSQSSGHADGEQAEAAPALMALAAAPKAAKPGVAAAPEEDANQAEEQAEIAPVTSVAAKPDAIEEQVEPQEVFSEGTYRIEKLDICRFRFVGYGKRKKDFFLPIGKILIPPTTKTCCLSIELLGSGHLQYNYVDGSKGIAKVPSNATNDKVWCMNCDKAACPCSSHRLENDVPDFRYGRL